MERRMYNFQIENCRRREAMRIIVIFLALISLLLGSQAKQSDAQVNFGGSIGDEGLKGFYVAVGEYYTVPQRE
jgi:hypothetical protein